MNLWQRQWSSEMQVASLQFAKYLLQMSGTHVAGVDTVVAAAKQRCRDALVPLSVVAGEPEAHHVVGHALKILNESWFCDVAASGKHTVEGMAAATLHRAILSEASLRPVSKIVSCAGFRYHCRWRWELEAHLSMHGERSEEVRLRPRASIVAACSAWWVA